MRLLLILAFLASIVIANLLTSTYGMIPVGFGLTATAGTYFAGATFLLRDGVQEVTGKWTVAAVIALGAGLSYVLADPMIAVASGVAFLVSELLDFAIYTPLRDAGHWLSGVAVSNTVGAFVDTVLFLAIAGFPIWSSVPGQMLAKVTVTAIFVAAAAGSRAVLRKPV